MSLPNARSVTLAKALPAAEQSILPAFCRVICMSCGDVTERQPFQDLLAELNPRMAEYVATLPDDAARTGQLDRDMPETVCSAVQLLASDGCMRPSIDSAMKAHSQMDTAPCRGRCPEMPAAWYPGVRPRLSCAHQAPGKLRRPDGDVELPDGEKLSEKLPDGLPRRPDGDVELSAGMRDFVVPPCVLL